jgi:hypothetical protein
MTDGWAGLLPSLENPTKTDYLIYLINFYVYFCDCQSILALLTFHFLLSATYQIGPAL